jgi:hypothetical protein
LSDLLPLEYQPFNYDKYNFMPIHSVLIFNA